MKSFYIFLIPNPADKQAEICEVTFCYDCAILVSQADQDTHFWKENWKPKINFHVVSQHSDSKDKSESQVTFTYLSKEGLRISNLEDKKNYYSSYFILQSEYPRGYDLFSWYSIYGRFIQTDKTIPHLPNVGIDFFHLGESMETEKGEEFAFSNAAKTASVALYVSDWFRILYWFTISSESCDINCTDETIIQITEQKSYCSNKKTFFSVTTYKLSDILNLYLQAGYYSCLIKVDVISQNIRQFKLFIHHKEIMWSTEATWLTHLNRNDKNKNESFVVQLFSGHKEYRYV